MTEPITNDLAQVARRLGEHDSSYEVQTWLHARHPQLDGARAIDLIRDGRSAELLAILDRLDADAYL
jgi:hypothetical protein